MLVMEFVDGPSLAEVLRRGPLPSDRAAGLGADVAACLAYLHARGVVHRDVKPANLLIASDGRAQLADFGIARLVDATRLTLTGQSIGTPSYMSPEQLTGARVGPPADVYALGLVLLEARTGRRAFSGQGHEAVAARLARGPDVRADELGPGWARLLAAMTAREPERRPTAATVAAVLGAGRVDDTAPTRVLRARRRPPWWWAVAAVAVVVLGVAAGVAASLGGTSPAARPGPARGATATSAPAATALTTAPGATVAPVTRPSPPSTAALSEKAHAHGRPGHGHAHG